VPTEKSLVAFLPVGTSEIELVLPTTNESGLAKYLEKRGPGMHHICLEVDDLEGMLATLKEKGIQLINETPLPGSGGKMYAFVHPRNTYGVLVELYQLPQ
jgi:methylmalonyl-CoA/ethylmalonyl-CoA epimerase